MGNRRIVGMRHTGMIHIIETVWYSGESYLIGHLSQYEGQKVMLFIFVYPKGHAQKSITLRPAKNEKAFTLFKG